MKLRLLGAVCTVTLVILANTAHAVIANPILGLDIGGTLYDITFHDSVGDSFNALWDADNDGVFGGGGSVFTAAPTFWGDSVGGSAARGAIIAVLGDTDSTTGLSDGFFIPVYGDAPTSTMLSSAMDFITVKYDSTTLLSTDTPGTADITDGNFDWTSVHPFVSFSTTAVVPVPAAVWLFGSGLLGLVGLARRKKIT